MSMILQYRCLVDQLTGFINISASMQNYMTVKYINN
ncbi:hypothetical protein LINPERPRIM_LOCUS25357 [Linum perenne]